MRNGEDLIREWMIYPLCVVLFPFFTIRILAWKWYVWIEKSEEGIQKAHRSLGGGK